MTTRVSQIKQGGDALNKLAMGLHIDSGVAALGVGATAARPANLTNDDIGHMFFDTTLHKPVWWKGGGWVDATGTAA